MSAPARPEGAGTSWSVDEVELARRRTAVEKARRRRAAPTSTASTVLTATIAAPATAVWSALTDPDRSADMLEVPPFVACTAPWTPDGAVGELSCIAARMPDGSVRAGLEETVLREPGRRLVSRTRSVPFPASADWTIDALADDRCTVRVVTTVQAPLGMSRLLCRAYRAGLRAGIWRLRRTLADPAVAREPEPPLPWLERRGRRREAATAARLAAGPRMPVAATRSLVLPVPGDAAWALVRATGSPVVERGDPFAVCFTPNGGPPDTAGALRLVVGRDPLADLELLVEQVVEVAPGARLHTRDLTAFGAEAEVTVTASGAGCRIDVRLAREVLPGQAKATGLVLGRRAEAYLDRLGRALTGMPALHLEDAWVG